VSSTKVIDNGLQ